jgi:hypothetical protein
MVRRARDEEKRNQPAHAATIHATDPRARCRSGVRAALAVVLASGVATAEPAPTSVGDVPERAHTLGVIPVITWDGAPSAGAIARLAVASRFAIAGEARARSGALVADLGLVWQVTQGTIAATYGDRAVYPIRFELALAGGITDRHATVAVGAALRVRASRRLTLDVSLRDELARADRPGRFVHIPELLLAVAWTAGR